MKYFAFIICFLLFGMSPIGAVETVQGISIHPSSFEEMVDTLLPFKVGDEYDSKLEQISKRLLMTTDKFDKVDVVWTASDGIFRVRLVPKVFFEETEWQGDSFVGQSSVGRVCLNNYEPFPMSAKRKSDLVDCLEREIRGFGYLNARVDLKTETHLLRIGVEAGPRFKVGSISFVGRDEISEVDLELPLVNKKGATFLPSQLEADTKRLLKTYFEHGFYFAEIFQPSVQVDSEKNHVHLVWRVREGREFDVKFTGYRKSRELLYEYLEREQTLPPWFTDEIADSLSAEFREDGYLDCRVEVNREISDTGVELIDIHSKRGPRYYLQSPEWVGVGSPQDMDLLYAKVADVQKGDSFEEALYRRTLEGEFLGVLKANGYLDATIQNMDFVIDRDKKRVRPVIYMNEGSQFRLNSVEISDVPQDAEDFQEYKDLKKKFRKGDVFNIIEFEKLKLAFQKELVAIGYLDALLNVSIERNSGAIDLKVKVLPGKRYRIAKILVRGAIKTDYEVVRREVRLQIGDFYEDEAIKDTVSQVLRLGIARNVDVQVLEKDADSGLVYVLVDIQESPRFRFEIGPGYGTLDGLRGVFRATWANIGGTARSLSLYAKLSRRLDADNRDPADYLNYEETPFIQRRVSLEYFEPSVLGFPIDGRLVFTHQKLEKQREGEKNGFLGAVDYRLNRHWTFTTQYELAFTDPLNIKKPAAVGDADSKRFTSLGEIISMDYLDDSFNPQKGWRSRWSAEIYDSRLGGDSNFWRASMRQEFFHPLFVLRRGRFVGLALNCGLGFSESFKPTLEVPVEKRSEIGGETTVRGYGQSSINPRLRGSDLYQDGGNSYFFFQSELHFPIISDFDLMGFFDGGNAYLTNEDFRPWSLRYGSGPAIRWNTPVGPIKVGYGFIIGRRTGEPLGHLFIGVGPI